MKIQIFTRNFLGNISNFNVKENSAVGGAEVYLMQLIDAINSKFKNAEIEVYQIGDENKRVVHESFSLNYIKLNKFEKMFFPFVLSFKFNKFTDQNSLKIFNYPNYAAFMKKQSKSIGIFHGVEWDTNFFDYVKREYLYRDNRYIGLVASSMKYFYFRIVVPLMVRKGIDKLEKIVSVDTNIKNYIYKDDQLKKINVIQNCVDVNFFSGIRNNKNENKNKKIILVPRNLNIARGVYLLPDVVEELLLKTNDFEIQVVGTGPLKKYIDQETSTRKIEKYIKLLGHIGDRKEMVEIYRNSDIILIPTVFSEGTSISALEALACSKPVIMTEVGGLKEIAINNESKISSNATPRDIADNILKIINNEELREKLSLHSREYVEKNNNYSNWSQQWIELIESRLK
ncbi:glycosyltransferase family 4 protein [Exiguobacterium chiriqhucha]|uniref:glycosyltransferase family 4 protein n=1 Tax=Exiguobacterium chiriqhucha TaxID=1385984 RepID=UPI0038BC8C4E